MKESLRELRSCTDAYLIRGISVLMGSVVIDRSLGIYRLHGMNVFSKHPNLYCMLHYERGGPSDNDLFGRKLVIDHLIANVGLFLHKLESTQAIYEGIAGARRHVAAHSFDGWRLPVLSGRQAGHRTPRRSWASSELFNFVVLVDTAESRASCHLVGLSASQRQKANISRSQRPPWKLFSSIMD